MALQTTTIAMNVEAFDLRRLLHQTGTASTMESGTKKKGIKKQANK